MFPGLQLTGEGETRIGWERGGSSPKDNKGGRETPEFALTCCGNHELRVWFHLSLAYTSQPRINS